MYFSQFSRSLKKGLAESVRSYGHRIDRMSDDSILIDGETTDFKSIEEAKIYIKNRNISETLEQEITKEIYEEITEDRIANIIREHHNVKVTDTLVESYIELASSNIFTIDPVVHKIRSMNKLDRLVEGKIHYQLADGSVVAINEATLETLNNLLQNQTEIVEYMKEGKNNFLHVLEQIGE